jgi:hypothetical protein
MLQTQKKVSSIVFLGLHGPSGIHCMAMGQNRPPPKRIEVISMNTTSPFKTVSLFCLSLVALMLPLKINAQDGGFDKFTKVTFSAPVEIPDVGAQVLPAGTYVFKLVGNHLTGNRHVVQILNEDQTHVYAAVLAIPNDREQPTGDTVMMYEDRACRGD